MAAMGRWHALVRSEGRSLAERVSALLLAPEGRRDWSLCFYSRGLLFSWRRGWDGWSRIWRGCWSGFHAEARRFGGIGFAQRRRDAEARRGCAGLHCLGEAATLSAGQEGMRDAARRAPASPRLRASA